MRSKCTYVFKEWSEKVQEKEGERSDGKMAMLD